MAYFVKYCEEEFNIAKSCNTLQINTFKNLSEIEKRDGIGDGSEGRAEWRSHIEKPGDPQAIQQTEFINCFVFSLSYYDNNEEVEPDLFLARENYDSCYIIRDLNTFLHYLLGGLQTSLRFSHLEENSLLHLPVVSTRNIQVELLKHGNVNYSEQENGVYSSKGHPRQYDTNYHLNTIFQKHIDYQYQREYRIVIGVSVVFANGEKGLISVKPEPIILNLNPINAISSLTKAEAFGVNFEGPFSVIGDE
jgi:hypothetical protein